MGRPISLDRITCYEDSLKAPKIPIKELREAGWVLVSFKYWSDLAKIPVTYPRYSLFRRWRVIAFIGCPLEMAKTFVKEGCHLTEINTDLLICGIQQPHRLPSKKVNYQRICLEKARAAPEISLADAQESGWEVLTFRTWAALAKVPVFFPRYSVRGYHASIKGVVAVPPAIAAELLKDKQCHRCQFEWPGRVLDCWSED